MKITLKQTAMDDNKKKMLLLQNYKVTNKNNHL